MRKHILPILLSAVALLALPAAAQAKDWVAKPNEEIFNDMIVYAEVFLSDAKGTPAEKTLKDFISKSKKKFSSDEYAWLIDTYDVCAKLERMFPPCVDDGSKNAEIRRHIVRLVDYPVHFDNMSKDVPKQAKEAYDTARDHYRSAAAESALAWLRGTRPADGELAIFKVYNMCFLFRTSKRTIMIDPCVHASDVVCRAITKEVDVFFLTHPHGDHYTRMMMEEIARQGKILVTSYDVVPWYRSDKKIVLWEDIFDPYICDGIEVRTHAGNQNTSTPRVDAGTPCNVYNLRFDGWTIMTNGDNMTRRRQTAAVSRMPAPDILICASWNAPKALMDAVRQCADWTPEKTLFIPSHENEFGHPVNQRESYWEDMNRIDRYNDPDYPYFPMAYMDIGEGMTVTKAGEPGHVGTVIGQPAGSARK